MDAAREERLRALGDAEPTAQSDREKEEWGDSDEEPDDAQRELMRRTAMHLSNSPNPAQLEMRILANHGADRRFAFLRGRWGRAWRTAKAGVRMEKEEKKEGGGLGGLAGYGDSDEDENSANGEGKPDTGKGAETGADKMSPSATEQVVIGEDEEALKAARRAKAKEWAARRRAAKEAD
ncbi:hypothetical protein NEOLEDRAFT_1127116 [Neolentinus lepideus HHB14362 ss-1]|uniref:Uncharacterized protein n=1 Tax=Neolentinus lepideus HHB14362 ss-1 TaxID=1314782 RepID=A0A165VUA7_9AGAM|nr:hypothetical protein NEOLEDRAFT_1127116 [Neolentinus lepideus HHB14362 ss-1]